MCFNVITDCRMDPNIGGAGLLTTHPPIFKQFPKLSVANQTSKGPLIYWTHWWSLVNSKFTDPQGAEPTRQICQESANKWAGRDLKRERWPQWLLHGNYTKLCLPRDLQARGWAGIREEGCALLRQGSCDKMISNIDEDVTGLIPGSLTTVSPPTPASEMSDGHYGGRKQKCD